MLMHCSSADLAPDCFATAMDDPVRGGGDDLVSSEVLAKKYGPDFAFPLDL
jgi:hypothetical protein